MKKKSGIVNCKIWVTIFIIFGYFELEIVKSNQNPAPSTEIREKSKKKTKFKSSYDDFFPRYYCIIIRNNYFNQYLKHSIAYI